MKIWDLCTRCHPIRLLNECINPIFSYFWDLCTRCHPIRLLIFLLLTILLNIPDFLIKRGFYSLFQVAIGLRHEVLSTAEDENEDENTSDEEETDEEEESNDEEENQKSDEDKG